MPQHGQRLQAGVHLGKLDLSMVASFSSYLEMKMRDDVAQDQLLE
jgi:hypothetical protein